MKKKIFTTIFLVIITLMLSACGNKEISTKGSSEKEEQKLKEPFSGTYETFGLFDTTYVFNENTTYDAVSETRPDYDRKGTFKIYGKDSLFLVDKDSNGEEKYIFRNGYLFRDDAFSYFEEDEEYGLELNLDSNGRTNQQFRSELIYGATTNNRHMFFLTLKDDGTCTVNYNILKDMGWGDRIATEEYDGTYEVQDDIMIVKYNDSEHPMLIQNGRIYFWGLGKIE